MRTPTLLLLALLATASAHEDILDRHPASDAVLLASFNRGLPDNLGLVKNTGSLGGNAVVTTYTDCDGTDDYIDYGDHDLFSLTDGAGNDVAGSISAWVNLRSTSGTGAILAKENYNGTNRSEYYFVIASGKLRMALTAITGNTGLIREGTTTLSANTWYHVGAAYDGSETLGGIRLYLNGVEQSYTTILNNTYTGMGNTTANLYVGTDSAGTFFDLNGLVDGVMLVRGRALSAAEFGAIYAGGRR